MKIKLSLFLIVLFIFIGCSENSNLDKIFGHEIRRGIELRLPDVLGKNLKKMTIQPNGDLIFYKRETMKSAAGALTNYFFTGYAPVKVKMLENMDTQTDTFHAGKVYDGRIYFMTTLFIEGDSTEVQIHEQRINFGIGLPDREEKELIEHLKKVSVKDARP
jgi:hypothetical protein